MLLVSAIKAVHLLHCVYIYIKKFYKDIYSPLILKCASSSLRLYIKKFHKDIYSPLILKCAQEFVWVTFYSYSVLTNKTKYFIFLD